MGQKGENKPSEPKNEIWGQNQYDRVTCPSIGNFTWIKQNIKKKFPHQKDKNN
jgi:hypothetical protein